MRRGRKRREPLLDLSKLAAKRRVAKQMDRFCFSKDGVFCNDGEFRWWQEFDDSGYGWNGCFDIITRVELKHRIEAARALNVPVFEKYSYGNVEEHEMYELVDMSEYK